MKKSALVTGGAGFIGSHLTDKLISENWEVTIVDNLSSGHREYVNPKVKNFMLADFSSSEVLKMVEGRNYDYVFHLAAIPRVSFSVANPLESHETNVTKTLSLIDSCRNGNVKRFMFASSSSVYGGADTLPTPETYQKNPKSPYALQKSIIEDYLIQYWLHYKLESVCLRLFNVFGPRQLGGSPYSTAVSAWLTSIKSGDTMRSDGDGSQSRDLCYVDNVTQAFHKAAIAEKEFHGEYFNVACGEKTKNIEILDHLTKKYPGVKWSPSPVRAGDVMHTHADLNLIQATLGYKPTVKFWEGLSKTVEWYENNWEVVKNYEEKKC